VSESDSCDVSVSMCEDNDNLQEDVGIANKIRCVNVHNNIPNYKHSPNKVDQLNNLIR
jgi:hypothetical protein